MLNEQHTSLKDALNKEEVEAYFNEIFEQQDNTECFECGKKTKQWADRSHAIFLCLNCAALYKELKWAISVKSISLDLWSKQELELLKLGGNKRFKEFLQHYQLMELPYKEKFKTNAAHHYRIMLKEQLNGRQAPDAPIKQIGQQHIKDQLPLTEMNTDELLEFTKEKAVWLGSKTKEEAIWLGRKSKEYGGKAYDKVSQKIQSGQLKEDAKKAAKTVQKKASALWAFALSKVNEYKGQKKQQESESQPINL